MPYKTLVFSASYALMLYTVMYYTNTMFLDAMIAFPLIALGIDLLVERGTSKLYIVALALLFICQYYFGFIATIGAALYFAYKILLKNKLSQINWRLPALKQYILSTLISIGLAMLILLPVALSLGDTVRNSNREAYGDDRIGLVDGTYHALPFLQFFGDIGEITPTFSPPNLFCGLLIAILAVCYFINRNISKREKQLSAAFIAIFIISFVTPTLNYLWHGLTFPNAFMFRQSFILVFFVIFLAYRCFLHIEAVNKRQLLLIFPALCLAFTVYNTFVTKSPIFYISIPLILISVAVLTLIINRPRHTLAFLTLGFINTATLVALSTFILFTSVTDGAHELKPFAEYSDNIRNFRNIVSEIQAYDTGFYRVEKNFQYTENDPLLFGYMGVNHYSSSVNNATMLFLEKLHMNRAGRIRLASGYDQNAPVSLDMLLGLKYFLISNAETGMWINTKLDLNDVDVIENTYALPIGFMAEKDLDQVDLSDVEYFELINQIFQALSGIDTPIFTTFEPPFETENLKVVDGGYVTIFNDINGTITYQLPETDNLLYFVSGEEATMPAKLDGIEMSVYAGAYPLSDKINGTLTNELAVEINPEDETDGGINATGGMKFYEESKDALGEHYVALADEPCDLRKITSSHLVCTVEASKDGSLFFTLPNDDGWVAKVDGKTVQTKTAFDLFMTIPLTAGTHNIELKYTPKGLRAGIFISFVTLIFGAVYGAKKFWKGTLNILAVATLNLKKAQVLSAEVARKKPARRLL
jgi:uncharacterized membrane protein YfhO